MNIKNGKEIRYYFFIICIYLFTFQNALQKTIPIIQYLDEIFALLLIPVLIVHLIKSKNRFLIKKYDLIIIVALSILVFTGIYSNIKYKYQPLKLAISDMLLILKFFMAYYLSGFIFKNEYINKYSKDVSKHIKLIIIFLLIMTILNYAFNLYSGEIRYGIKSNSLFYEHPTYLSAVCVMLLANLIMFEKKINWLYTGIIVFILCTTIRVKAIGFIFAFFCLAYFVNKRNRKITFSKIGIVALIIVAVAYQQLKFYFITIDDSARNVLLSTSIEIANDYFPFGTGFATYGSYNSAKEYSPIYKMYQIDNVFGLEEGKTFFISDNFWPMILGQFGYIGLMAYGICVLYVFKKIQEQYKTENKYIYIAKIICLLYLLISSTSESAFVNPISLPLGIILGM